MKRLLCIIVSLMMLASVFTGCGPKNETADSTAQQSAAGTSEANTNAQDDKELKELKVAVMPFLNSIPVKYIIEKGWDKEEGIKIETVLFATGAPMNEALGANLWDVGCIGTAAVTGVPTYDAKVIAEISDAAGGIELFVRPDSPIAKVKGFNPTFEDLLGNPETVKGKQVMLPVGTIMQLAELKWLEKIGLKDKDVKTVHMEYAQAYQAFLAGQGDIVGLNPPLSYKARENGWIPVASLNSLKIPQYDQLMVNKKSYESKRAELVKFVKLMYRANAELMQNPETEVKVLSDWYKENGQTIDEKTVREEVRTRPLLTAEDVKKKALGDSLKVTAEFMASIGKLQTEKLPIFDKNIVDDILQEALK